MKKTVISTFLLLGLLNAHGQYMSFFGDSTWIYHTTYITQSPEDYLEYPPEEPNLLGVYCRTLTGCYRVNPPESSHPGEISNYYCNPFIQDVGVVWDWAPVLKEDTVHGRLYNMNYLICDMSLSVGDTFVHKGMCDHFYDGLTVGSHYYIIDTIRIKMGVDSVQYISNRKTIFLSLVDHQDDYFFGTGNGGFLSDYNLSIRFIEGIGPTYGLTAPCMYPHLESDGNFHGNNDVYFAPWLGLLQCMYKDDSLVYMTHENLSCNQTCLGLYDYPQPIINLYPNPATQYVVLDMSTGDGLDGMVMITDMLGREYLQQKAEGTSVRISVSDLPTGMYFLTYTDGNRKSTRKFMKR